VSEAQPFQFKDFVLYQWKSGSQLTRRWVENILVDLTDDELNWQSAPGIHSIWHHVWHMYLGLDYLVAHAFEVEPAWEEDDWRSRIDLTSMEPAFEYEGIVFGYAPRFSICEVPDQLVDGLKAPRLADFMAYVDSMLERCTGLIEAASDADLCVPYSSYGRSTPRVYSLGLNRLCRHLGMMESVKGQMRGPGQGSAST
jgi:DinB superfamily